MRLQVDLRRVAEKGNSYQLVVIREHQGPVIGPDHPDVKASNNRSGFETGQLIKHQGVYTAKMKDNGFSAVGKCTLGWAAK